MALNSSNNLPIYDTKANIEANTQIIPRMWCQTSDTVQIAILKEDDTWAYIGADNYWDINYPVYSTINANDSIQIENMVDLSPFVDNVNVKEKVFKIGSTNKLTLYQLDGESGIVSGADYDTSLGKWYHNTFDGIYPKKIELKDSEVSFLTADTSTFEDDITWDVRIIKFTNDEAYFQKYSQFVLKDSGDSKLFVNSSGVAINKERDTVNNPPLEIGFGSLADTNYLQIKSFDGVTGGNDPHALIEVEITIGGGTLTRYIEVHDIPN